MIARANYERFLRDLEAIATTMEDTNVAGIEPGLADQLHALAVRVFCLKHKARRIGSLAAAAEEGADA